MPWWLRAGVDWLGSRRPWPGGWFGRGLSNEEELELLRRETADLEQALTDMRARIEQLEGEQAPEPGPEADAQAGSAQT